MDRQQGWGVLAGLTVSGASGGMVGVSPWAADLPADSSGLSQAGVKFSKARYESKFGNMQSLLRPELKTGTVLFPVYCIR